MFNAGCEPEPGTKTRNEPEPGTGVSKKTTPNPIFFKKKSRIKKIRESILFTENITIIVRKHSYTKDHISNIDEPWLY